MMRTTSNQHNATVKHTS